MKQIDNPEQLLKSIKKANKVRREKVAKDYGFNSYESMKQHLELGQEYKAPKQKRKPKKLPVVHIVDIVDCSGSMSGSKIQNAVIGINEGIDKLIEEQGKDVFYKYTCCSFSSKAKFNVLNKDPEEIEERINFYPLDMTALYDAIGITFKKLDSFVKLNEKVLINIYTDRNENYSKKYRRSYIKKEIERRKGQFTVTFIGTEIDCLSISEKLGVDLSNMKSYDNTGKGLAEVLNVTFKSRADYSTKVSLGKDVSRGFYKNITK
jgi:uncharacterized protein YegL